MKLIINPIGGLANRMRAIAAGLALADECNVKAQVIWGVNSELRARFNDIFIYPEGVEIHNISATRELLTLDVARKRNLFLSSLFKAGRYAAQFIDKGACNPVIDNPAMAKHLLTRPGNQTILIRSGLEFYPISPDKYRALFIPTRIITSQVEKWLACNGASRMVGLHIRRTDNAVSISESPDEVFINAVQQELTHDEHTEFFLATDSQAVKREFKSRFGDKRIHCFTAEADRNSKHGIQQALIEMLLLSRCACIYGSYWSSFSEAAALLGNKPLFQLRNNSRP